jgi:hypothetical protein
MQTLSGGSLPPRAIDISRKKSIKRRTEIISNAAAVSADTSIDVMATGDMCMKCSSLLKFSPCGTAKILTLNLKIVLK